MSELKDRVQASVTHPERLAEIDRLQLLDRMDDPVLTSIVEEAAERLGLPIGLVSLVLDQAQYFIASKGLEGWLKETRGTPVEWAFCAQAVASGEPFVVPDAQTHPVVRENPLVTRGGIRSYAGVPLVTPTGHALGTLCVIGTEAREFSDAELKLLSGYATRVMEHVQSRKRIPGSP